MSRKTIRQAQEVLAPFARLFANLSLLHYPPEQRFVIVNRPGHGSYARPWSGQVCGFTIEEVRRVQEFMEP